jgi:7,8-dihydroneopterin aldolase/epimerase/oxygenase
MTNKKNLAQQSSAIDKVFVGISELKLHTVIGCNDGEKLQKRPLYVNLLMQIPQDSAANDDINNTIGYDKVSDMLKNFAANCRCNLIEHFAQKVAYLLLDSYKQILWLKVEVKKPGSIFGAQASIAIYEAFNQGENV